MRKIIAVVFLVMPFFANGLEKVELIQDYPDQPKEKIFNTAKQWIAKNFKSANDVIQYSDLGSGTIVGKGNMVMPCKGFLRCTNDTYLNFTLTVDTKDGKARFTFDDYYASYLNNPYISSTKKQPLSNKQSEESLPVLNDMTKKIAADIGKSLNGSGSESW